jgi:hypothetical protein
VTCPKCEVLRLTLARLERELDQMAKLAGSALVQLHDAVNSTAEHQHMWSGGGAEAYCIGCRITRAEASSGTALETEPGCAHGKRVVERCDECEKDPRGYVVAPEPPEKTWDCICGRSNYVTSFRCAFCERRRRPPQQL